MKQEKSLLLMGAAAVALVTLSAVTLTGIAVVSGFKDTGLVSNTTADLFITGLTIFASFSSVVALALIFIILAPLFSRLTYLAISRKREYLADANGAYLTRNPAGLARALEQIKADLPDAPKVSKTVAPLYIANPFKRSLRNSIWSTHPPIDERIRRLKSM